MKWLQKSIVISIFLFSIPVGLVPLSALALESTVKIFNADKENQDTQRQAHIAQGLDNNRALLIESPSPFSGPKEANTHLIVFADYGCIHCKKLASVLEILQKREPNLKIIHKELPMLGAQSSYAAKAALAANKQNKYLSVNAHLMKSQALSKSDILNIISKAGLDKPQFDSDMASKEIDKEIEQNATLAKNLTIETVPVMIVLNAQKDKAPTFFILGNPKLKTLQTLIHKTQN